MQLHTAHINEYIGSLPGPENEQCLFEIDCYFRMNLGNVFALPSLLYKFVTNNGNESSDDQFHDSSSSSESEDNSLELDSNSYKPTNFHVSTFSMNKFSSKANLSAEDVQNVEGDLDLYETISLIFLLYENNLGLQVIHVILNAYDLSKHLDKTVYKGKISSWVRSQPNTWKPMLIEALAVIQNYKVLKKLGYDKKEVDEWCSPRIDTSLMLNRAKKMLYLLCEKLSKEQTKKLIEMVNSDTIFENNITTNSDSIFLEYFLLFWISQQYLKLSETEDISLNNLSKHLKIIDSDEAENINGLVKSINKERKSTGLKKHNTNYDDVYKIINPDIIGLCIIVDMCNFTKDTREEFKELAKEKLYDREGSSHDVYELTNTFGLLKFKVEKLQNIMHDRMQLEIQRTIKLNFKPDYSALFLCILSHGSEGKIYAANCVPVTIQEIQNYICGPLAQDIEELLANKPKVIIVQACQGSKLLYVDPTPTSSKSLSNVPYQKKLDTDGCDLVFDGPESFLPKHCDVLVCMAVIEGYMSVRGRSEGTKYIQELCRCLKKYYLDHHFLDIIIRVHDSLNSQEMHVPVKREELSNCNKHSTMCAKIYMTPSQYGTLRKKLFLVSKS